MGARQHPLRFSPHRLRVGAADFFILADQRSVVVRFRVSDDQQIEGVAIVPLSKRAVSARSTNKWSQTVTLNRVRSCFARSNEARSIRPIWCRKFNSINTGGEMRRSLSLIASRAGPLNLPGVFSANQTTTCVSSQAINNQPGLSSTQALFGPVMQPLSFHFGQKFSACLFEIHPRRKRWLTNELVQFRLLLLRNHFENHPRYRNSTGSP